MNLFETDISALDPDMLQLPLLPSKTKRATVVGSYEDFAERFDQMSGGLAREVADVEGLVFAGGSVVAALTDSGFGDVDIFLCCPRDECAAALRSVYEAAQRLHKRRHDDDAQLLLTCSKHAVTVFSHPSTFPPAQVILSVYESPLALLIDFDVDCCACAFLPKQKRAVCTPRCLRALRCGVYMAQSDCDGPGYHRCLLKYDCRGFAIAVPGFDMKRLSRTIVEGNYVLLEPYDLLLKAEPGRIEDLKLSVHTSGDPIEHRSQPSIAQRCTSVRGFGRLIAHKYANIQKIVASDIDSGRVRPVMGLDSYKLLYGLDDEVDAGNYSVSPLTCVHTLLKQVFDRKLQCTSETPQAEFEWWTGGAMQKFASKPVKDLVWPRETSVPTSTPTRSCSSFTTYALLPRLSSACATVSYTHLRAHET